MKSEKSLAEVVRQLDLDYDPQSELDAEVEKQLVSRLTQYGAETGPIEDDLSPSLEPTPSTEMELMELRLQVAELWHQQQFILEQLQQLTQTLVRGVSLECGSGLPLCPGPETEQ